jgi:hypothetical protein
VIKAEESEFSTSWERWRVGLAETEWSAGLRSAGQFALDVLERELGAGWPTYAGSKFGVPEELPFSRTHIFALIRVIELGLRLDLLKANPGMGKVRRTLKRSPSREDLQHITIAMEAGALAVMNGFDVEFEPILHEGAPPIDIALRGKLPLAVEVRSIFRDEASIEASNYADQLKNVIHALRMNPGVAIGGEIACVLDSDIVSSIAQELTARARFVAAGGISPAIQLAGVNLHVRIPGNPDDESLSIAIPMEDHWRRLRERLQEKSRRAAQSGAQWLRFDSLDFLWQLGPLAQMSLSQRLTELSDRVVEWLRPFGHIRGLVLTDGAWMLTVNTPDETHQDARRGLAMKRRLDPFRARETLIVPLFDEALEEARHWYAFYDDESSWMKWALDRYAMTLPDELNCDLVKREVSSTREGPSR